MITRSASLGMGLRGDADQRGVVMTRYLLGAALAVLLSGLPQLAMADDLLDFSYKFSDGATVSGVLTGTAVGGYFDISGIQSFTTSWDANINALGAVYLNESYDTVAALGPGYFGNGDGAVAINGSYLDFEFDADSADGSDNLLLGWYFNDLTAMHYGAGFMVRTNSAQNLDGFNPANWSASVEDTAVPEPASVVLLGVGFIGLVAVRRRNA
jgi:hypothetical protein